MNTITNSERYRLERAQQVEDRRAAIIDAAADLFLEKGLEQTAMLDIAVRAHISKVTLYRYFADRDPLAFEVAVRMLKLILSTAVWTAERGAKGMAAVEGFCLGMIREFPALSGAYRYLGMFDHVYGDAYPSEELATWYKKHIFDLFTDGALDLPWKDLDHYQYIQTITLFNVIMSFLEKMAARGELMGQEQELPLQVQLGIFEGMVRVYLGSMK